MKIVIAYLDLSITRVRVAVVAKVTTEEKGNSNGLASSSAKSRRVVPAREPNPDREALEKVPPGWTGGPRAMSATPCSRRPSGCPSPLRLHLTTVAYAVRRLVPGPVPGPIGSLDFGPVRSCCGSMALTLDAVDPLLF